MKTASRLIATLGMIAAPLLAAPAAQARVDVNVFIPGVSVDVRVGPPPLRYERLPGPRAGYLWRTGYWQWSPHGYVWIPGAWMSSRPGHIWVGEQWSPYGGNWHFQPGRWERRVEYREYRPHSMDMAGPRLGTTGVTIIPHSGNAENHHADHIDDPMMQRARQ
ncbi:MAG: hypothetical protein CGU28_13590 [Candidatus Dactylopiibacterium carminicum]|nr:MAG: hypothetical protein CGU28_13590 [Candidatus Dactylopiibacterium carminicum]